MNIALLTPYTGGNLGDAAIQEAAIQNVRTRYPDANLTLVSIFPHLTAGLHDVPSFPIGRLGQWQEGSASRADTDGKPSGAPPIEAGSEAGPGLSTRFKTAVKSSRLLYSALKPVQQKLWPVYDELLHIRRVRQFLNSVDLVVVSGGGQLDEYWGGPWDHPYALFKWGLLAKITGSRFVVLSVGTCALESKLSVFFIRNALRLASYRSYRDRTSKVLLESMRFTRNDRVYPDLAFSYSNETAFGSPHGNGKTVGVSPICYLSPHGWPEEDAAVYERYFEALVSLVRVLARQGFSIVLFSSDGPDAKIVDDIVDALAEEGDPEVTSRISHPCTRTLPELLEQLGKVDYVVASRLHGVLLSHRFCLPVLAISYDRKVDTYMEDVGMPAHCVDIHDVSGESLVRGFEDLVHESHSIRSQLAEINDRYAHELQRQYDVVLKPSTEERTREIRQIT